MYLFGSNYDYLYKYCFVTKYTLMCIISIYFISCSSYQKYYFPEMQSRSVPCLFPRQSVYSRTGALNRVDITITYTCLFAAHLRIHIRVYVRSLYSMYIPVHTHVLLPNRIKAYVSADSSHRRCN